MKTTSAPGLAVDSNFFDGFSAFKGAAFLEGNPVFVNAAKGSEKLNLKSNSPCKNKGNPEGAPPMDAAGKKRSDGKPDIGAFEF